MGSMQPQPFRAAPPPPAPPGIVLQGNIDGRLILVKEPESARATSFRLLRDNLLARRLPRVIAVSSSLPADGKTTCAINLALALSEGARLLLLDGALSEPELDEIFGITEQTVPSAVHGPWAAPYRICELSPSMAIGGVVLPPGAPPARFERRWFEQLLGTLRRSHYDFIVIDTAALSSSPTVGQLVSSCDGTLIAVRAGITTARALRRATEQIPDGKAIGVALIDAKPTS
jgi:Mrp family chromosome partitioning ATPase